MTNIVSGLIEKVHLPPERPKPIGYLIIQTDKLLVKYPKPEVIY